jgi:bile acid:Na+ symporter, BASS family
MHPIDAIKINFSPDNLLVLNIGMAFITFGIALDIQKDDFEMLWKNPKPAIVGMIAQLVINPLITFLLVFIFNPPPSVALGMVAIAACPGGNNSNYTAYLAGGNTALAVTTTSLSILASMLTLPFYIWTGTQIIPNMSSLERTVHLNPMEMVKIVGFLIVLPLIAGMYVNNRFPKISEKIRRPFKILSLFLFFAIIIGAMAANISNIVNYVGKVFFVVLVLNIASFATGYWFARLNKLPEADCRALTFETGIHNITLALIVIFNFFDGLGGMALVAAWYGIWDLMTGFSLAYFWGRNSDKWFKKA